MPVGSMGEIHETHLKVNSVLALLQSQKMVSGTLRKEHRPCACQKINIDSHKEFLTSELTMEFLNNFILHHIKNFHPRSLYAQ
jgi:hypothetical protein